MAGAKGPPGFHLTQKPAMPGLVAEGDWHGHLVSISASGQDLDGATATLAQLHGHWADWERRIAEAIAELGLAASTLEIEAIYSYDHGRFEVEFLAPASFGRTIALATGSINGGIENVAKGS